MPDVELECFHRMWAENKWNWAQNLISLKEKKKQRQKEKKGMNNVVYNSQQGFFSLFGGSLIFLHPSLWPEHKDAQTLSFERLSRHCFEDLMNSRRYCWPVLSLDWAVMVLWTHVRISYDLIGFPGLPSTVIRFWGNRQTLFSLLTHSIQASKALVIMQTSKAGISATLIKLIATAWIPNKWAILEIIWF